MMTQSECAIKLANDKFKWFYPQMGSVLQAHLDRLADINAAEITAREVCNTSGNIPSSEEKSMFTIKYVNPDSWTVNESLIAADKLSSEETFREEVYNAMLTKKNQPEFYAKRDLDYTIELIWYVYDRDNKVSNRNAAINKAIAPYIELGTPDSNKPGNMHINLITSKNTDYTAIIEGLMKSKESIALQLDDIATKMEAEKSEINSRLDDIARAQSLLTLSSKKPVSQDMYDKLDAVGIRSGVILPMKDIKELVKQFGIATATGVGQYFKISKTRRMIDGIATDCFKIGLRI